MMTVPEVARRVGVHPETVRRWIRTGRLASDRVGTQHLVDESEVEALAGGDTQLTLPEGWRRTVSGRPMPNVVRAVRDSRRGR